MVDVWRRPSSSAVQTSREAWMTATSGRCSTAVSKKPEAATASRRAASAAGESVASYSHEAGCPLANDHSPPSRRASTVVRTHTRPSAVTRSTRSSPPVSTRRSSRSGSGASDNRGPRRRAAPRRAGHREVAQRARRLDRPSRTLAPLAHAAHLLERVEEGDVVLRPDLLAPGHDAVRPPLHPARLACGGGDVRVLRRLAPGVGALP